MGLANMQGKLSRTEMKNIMAGSGRGCNEPGECLPQTLTCNGQQVNATATCRNGSCVYSAGC